MPLMVATVLDKFNTDIQFKIISLTNLRSLTSTEYSITIAWDVLDSQQPKSQAAGQKNSEASSVEPREFHLSPSNDENCFYVVQMKGRLFDWIVVYTGFKTVVEVGRLAPGLCFQFRVRAVKNNQESEWSECLYAATKDEVIRAGQLFRAVQNRHLANVKKIIGQRPSIVNISNKFGQSPLQVAISNGDLNMVGLLLNQGVDLGLTEPGSLRTPLMIAAYCGHLDIVKLLLEKGFSWEEKDRNGLTAFHYAVDNSRLEVVKFAIDCGVDVNTKDNFGWSPLMRAVILSASLDIVDYLLNNGGAVNEADCRRQTALMEAMLSDKQDVVKLLLSKGADVSKKNTFGRTASEMRLPQI